MSQKRSSASVYTAPNQPHAPVLSRCSLVFCLKAISTRACIERSSVRIDLAVNKPSREEQRFGRRVQHAKSKPPSKGTVRLFLTTFRPCSPLHLPFSSIRHILTPNWVFPGPLTAVTQAPLAFFGMCVFRYLSFRLLPIYRSLRFSGRRTSDLRGHLAQ